MEWVGAAFFLGVALGLPWGFFVGRAWEFIHPGPRWQDEHRDGWCPPTEGGYRPRARRRGNGPEGDPGPPPPPPPRRSATTKVA